MIVHSKSLLGDVEPFVVDFPVVLQFPCILLDKQQTLSASTPAFPNSTPLSSAASLLRSAYFSLCHGTRRKSPDI